MNVLEEDIIICLKEIQKKLKPLKDEYYVNVEKETSCVRCSGSIGRYVYDKKEGEICMRFSPSICITHACNLNCIYCYQKHDFYSSMNFDVAKEIIDWSFGHIPSGTSGIEFTFIGGEPLLEFNLIKRIYEYAFSRSGNINCIFYATTNGVLLTHELKTWFYNNRMHFYLRLSLDGTADTHNHNRSNSFNSLDIDFFRDTWPGQGVKMTLSDYSLGHLARDIKYIHSLGFDDIGGVNLCEGEFNWDKDKYLQILAPQLAELVAYYVENDHLRLDQLFDKRIDFCEAAIRPRVKRCGIGCGTVFFDIDGTKYPCTYITPMTFPKEQIEKIISTDFNDPENFIDDYCYHNCYLYPICPTCSGANYLVNQSFHIRNKSKCRLIKLTALYIADLQAKRILKNPSYLHGEQLYYTIEAIIHIKEKYKRKFEDYLV